MKDETRMWLVYAQENLASALPVVTHLISVCLTLSKEKVGRDILVP